MILCGQIRTLLKRLKFKYFSEIESIQLGSPLPRMSALDFAYESVFTKRATYR
jgi:hypothetical protein